MENSIEEVQARKDKGFTLVELLIVIVILGILATVTVFAVKGITDKGKAAGCAADRKTLETGVEAYYALKNVYPPTQADLVTENILKKVMTTYDVTTAAGSGSLPVYTAVAPCTLTS